MPMTWCDTRIDTLDYRGFESLRRLRMTVDKKMEFAKIDGVSILGLSGNGQISRGKIAWRQLGDFLLWKAHRLIPP